MQVNENMKVFSKKMKTFFLNALVFCLKRLDVSVQTIRRFLNLYALRKKYLHLGRKFKVIESERVGVKFPDEFA